MSNHVTEILDPVLEKLQKDNDRLLIQIGTCENMIEEYNRKHTDNVRKIIEIEKILKQNPT